MNTQILHIDVPVRLPPEARARAVLAAIKENPANARAPQAGGGYELAVACNRLWANGRTLRIRFMGGDPVVRQRVAETASEWCTYANLKFDFGDHAVSELRMAFRPGGSESCVGTNALVVPQNQPTINFGWLTPDLPQEKYSRVVLHEFGHAIGCIHEHQAPKAGIRWNKPAVYAYYCGVQGWSREEVDYNLFDVCDLNTTNHSAFDPQSIMIYPIPKEHTLDGYEVGWNSALSDTDKAFIAQVYPRGG